MQRLKLLYVRKSLYNTLLFHVILCLCHNTFGLHDFDYSRYLIKEFNSICLQHLMHFGMYF